VKIFYFNNVTNDLNISLFIMGSFTPKSPPFGVKIIFNQIKIVLEKNEV